MGKGQQVVDKNMEAIKAGYDYMKENLAERSSELMELEKADGKKRMFMIGNDAIALGALAGRLSIYGCISNYTSF